MNWTKYLPCLLILGMGSGCSSEVKHPGENQDLCLTDSLLKIVSVDTVHLHDVPDELTLNGRVTFNQEQVAHVYPMFGAPVDENSPVNRTLDKMGVTPYHCCYSVDDMEGAIARLKKIKFVPLIKAVEACAIGGRRVCFLFNKKVGLIELVES